MSNPEIGKAIELVAVEVGFRDGALVHKGARFEFTPTKLDKRGEVRIPKWAALPGSDRLKPKPEMSVDTRPVNARKAAKGKFEGLSGAAITD